MDQLKASFGRITGGSKGILCEEKLFVGGDFNGQVGQTSGGFDRDRVHRGSGSRNEVGKTFKCKLCSCI